jgi:hypothetical protein
LAILEVGFKKKRPGLGDLGIKREEYEGRGIMDTV